MSRKTTISQFIQSPAVFRHAMNWLFIPWLAAGIHISKLAPDWTSAQTQLKDRYFNMNYVGTHFGGSLYSMCDPVYMLMLMNILNKREFVVWDKAASIEYVSPGTGTVSADFNISSEVVEKLQALAVGEKSVFDLPVTILNEEKAVVATLVKTLYVKRKRDLSIEQESPKDAKKVE